MTAPRLAPRADGTAAPRGWRRGPASAADPVSIRSETNPPSVASTTARPCGQIVRKVMTPRFEAGNNGKVAEVVAGVEAGGGRIGCKRARNWALQLSAA